MKMWNRVGRSGLELLLCAVSVGSLGSAQKLARYDRPVSGIQDPAPPAAITRERGPSQVGSLKDDVVFVDTGHFPEFYGDLALRAERAALRQAVAGAVEKRMRDLELGKPALLRLRGHVFGGPIALDVGLSMERHGFRLAGWRNLLGSLSDDAGPEIHVRQARDIVDHVEGMALLLAGPAKKIDRSRLSPDQVFTLALRRAGISYPTRTIDDLDAGAKFIEAKKKLVRHSF